MEEAFELREDEVSVSVKDIVQFVDAVQKVVTKGDVDADVQVAFLRKVQEIVDRFPVAAPTGVTDDDPSSVLYALNPATTSWAAAHVTPEDRPLWQALGFSPEAAARWVEAGLSIEIAAHWKYLRPYHFRDDGIDPFEVAKWEKSRISSKQALRWMEDKISPERAEAWVSLGGGLTEGRSWLGAFPEESPEDLYAVSQGPLGVSEVRKYAERGVEIVDAPVFSQKGYTPFAAAKLVRDGVSAADATSKTGDAPIPGKAWPKIKAAADAKGWTVVSITEISSPYTRRPTKETQVVFSKPTSPHGDVHAYFETSRFKRGIRRTRSYWNEQTNTIGSFVKDYLV
jgi:hypothetical protein